MTKNTKEETEKILKEIILIKETFGLNHNKMCEILSMNYNTFKGCLSSKNTSNNFNLKNLNDLKEGIKVIYSENKSLIK